MAKEDKKERQLEYKRAKEDKRLENRAKFFYDISKMTLTATVLSLVPSFMDDEFSLTWKTSICFVVGSGLSVFFALVGDRILKR